MTRTADNILESKMIGGSHRNQTDSKGQTGVFETLIKVI